MRSNLGQVDRAARALLGVAVLATGYGLGSNWGWLGVIPLATALMGWCPLYVPFGLNTRAGGTKGTPVV